MAVSRSDQLKKALIRGLKADIRDAFRALNKPNRRYIADLEARDEEKSIGTRIDGVIETLGRAQRAYEKALEGKSSAKRAANKAVGNLYKSAESALLLTMSAMELFGVEEVKYPPSPGRKTGYKMNLEGAPQ